MPDPVLYFTAMCSTVGVSAIVVLTLGWLLSRTSPARTNLASVLGIGFGLAAGYYVLQLRLDWPPTNGISRLLFLVVPAVFLVELLAGSRVAPPWILWLLRTSLAAATGRILLHGSVYLGGPRSEWTTIQAGQVLTICAAFLMAEWGLLSWLSRRSARIAVPLAISLTLQAAGIAIMLAGYVTGGAAALPLVAAIVGATISACLFVPRSDSAAAIGVGTVGLFGLLFIGRFFGAVSTSAALTLMLSPLLCWVIEIPILRRRNRWLVGAIGLFVVAIPLSIVLFLAKQEFDQKTRPLISQSCSVRGPRATIST
jgi:hypothetical protein